MGALLAAGSRVRAGFEYSTQASSAESIAGYDSPANIQEVLAGAMLGSGVFSDAYVEVKTPSFAGLVHGYITAMGTTYTDVGDPYEIGTLIRGLIETYLPILTVTRQDAVAVDYVPPAAQANPALQQVYIPPPPGSQAQNQLNAGQQNQSGQQCSFSQQSIGDYLACQFGITSPIGGIAAGTIAGALGLLLVGGIALIALKRV
jgi:hypothetical protein